MNIYLISCPINLGYDNYSSAVVVARSEQEARMLHPSGRYAWANGRWENECGDEAWDKWPNPPAVNVRCIGMELPDQCSVEPRIILASYHAG